MKNLSLKSAKRAFTLVEIMIVVLIIGILLAIAVPNFIRAREQSRAKACSANLKQIDSAVQQYAMDNKLAIGATAPVYTTLAPAAGAAATSTNYLKSLPACPSSGAYSQATIDVSPTCSASSTTYPHTFNGQ